VKRRHDELLAKPRAGVNQRSLIYECHSVFSSADQWPTVEDISPSLKENKVMDLCAGCAEAGEDTCETFVDLEILRDEGRAHGFDVKFRVYTCHSRADMVYQIRQRRPIKQYVGGDAC
jgi:hypothetical protein